jgi:hypothetical protein
MAHLGIPLKSILAFALLTTDPLRPLMAQDYEIVDNSPFTIDENGITAPIVAVRPLTATTVSIAWLSYFRLTKQVIADAAMQFPEVRAELARRSLTPDDVGIDDWGEILEVSGYKDIYLYDPRNIVDSGFRKKISEDRKFVISDYASNPQRAIWDATTITKMRSPPNSSATLA